MRKIVVPSVDSQVRARLAALDARLNSVHTPNLAVALVAHLGASDLPFAALMPILADARNNEVWEQLPEEYYRLMLESGDALVTLMETAPPTGSAWTSAQVRQLCHLRLASLPRASLIGYRQRVDAEAKALLEQGRQLRSSIPLRRIADELFCSSVGDQALDLLGDLAFERGQFDEARHWWSLIAPLEPTGDDRLRYPDPHVDVVRVQAKQLLALIFQGRLDEAKPAIARFDKRHPNARGDLAGQEGVYERILSKTLTEFHRERISNNDEAWTTFGGAETRNHILSHTLSPSLWEDGPTWRIKLPLLDAAGKAARHSINGAAAIFHPVIVNDQVLIADHRSVVSYHLKTGKELFRYSLKAAGLTDLGPDPQIAMPRFTLTADRDRAYVRLGRLGIGPQKDAGKADASHLVCLDLTHPEKEKKRELWRITARPDANSPAVFEGAPLAHEWRVYIALTTIVDRHSVASIVCYDVLGRQRWTREVCDAPEFEGNASESRQRQHLLTWAGNQIVYCNHAGAIVAVDAWSGQPTWGVRYPSRGPRAADFEPSPRDLAPAVYADGCIFAAPLDSDRLFCIDAMSGQVRWEIENVEVVHLLGSAHGRVFVATKSGLQALNAATGKLDWAEPGEGRLPSLGRGLLVGSLYYWPTQDAAFPYRLVAQKTGEPAPFDPTRFSTLPAGNLAFGHGCLAIAGLDELVVFVPSPRLPPDVRPSARLWRGDFPDFVGRPLNNP